MLEQAVEYWTDAWQRSVLILEALNERGNIHLAQAAKEVPERAELRRTNSSSTGASCRARSTTGSCASFRPRAPPSIRRSRRSSWSIRAPATGRASAA